MQITFLAAGNGLRLSKTFTPSETIAYPLVKAVTSSDHDVTDLQDLLPLMKANAADGKCLLKGNLKRPLVNESRAGKADRAKYNQLLILDIDGIELPDWFFQSTLTSADIAKAAAQVVDSLPAFLHNVTYIAQASSSFGVKKDQVSMHLFFMLSVPLPPATIKLWLKSLNLTTPAFSGQIDLSANGQSLKYPIDLSVADNSHTCFISPPTFEGVQDPFASADDRFVLVPKQLTTFDLAGHVGQLNPQIVFEQEQALKDELRVAAGGRKKTAKIKHVAINNRNEEVLMNPDRMQITVADTSSLPFIRCNINGGDSNAYYFDLNDPRWMFNFKGEPNFEIEKADPEFFASIRELFEDELTETATPSKAIAFRDFDTDTFYCGLYNPCQKQFDDTYPLRPIQKQNIEDFLLNHATLMPDVIPEGRLVFDPTKDAPETNASERPFLVNTFRQSVYMQQAVKLDEPYTLGDSPKVAAACPSIHKLLLHVLGDGQEELERFINWLAFIFQTKQKSMSGWVLGGTQGTGKQIFYNHILRPLFGAHHVQVRKLQDIEEQFNSYMRDALFLIVDEFHMGSASAGTQKIGDKLKNQITEPTLTIRAMRSNQIELPSYTNFLFLTNRHDAVNLEESDRRYTIAPRQESKLVDKYPEILGNLKQFEQELPSFANILHSYDYNEQLARTAINNDAKETMRRNAMSVIEEFITAIREGDLYYFLPVLEIDVGNFLNPSSVSAAQKYVKTWIAESTKQESVVTTQTLNLIYTVLTDQKLSAVQFGKTLSRFGLQQKAVRVGSQTIRGHRLNWHLSDIDRQQLINNFAEHERNSFSELI